MSFELSYVKRTFQKAARYILYDPQYYHSFVFSFRAMSLPETFETSHEYFEEAVQFFREYQHLYNFPNTKLLLTDCLDRIDLDGLDKFDVFEIGTTLEAIADKNLSIRRLLDRISRLSVDYGSFESKEDLESMVDAPMGVKKMHEVTYLVNEIQDFCEETGCDTVVDFGSGLVSYYKLKCRIR